MNIIINLGWNMYLIKDVDSKTVDKLLTAQRIESTYMDGDIARYAPDRDRGVTIEIANPNLKVYTEKEINQLKAEEEARKAEQQQAA